MAEQDDELLQVMRRSPDGDLRAFEKLVQQHQRRIVADCRHIIRDETFAEDLAQEVFVKAYFGPSGFEDHLVCVLIGYDYLILQPFTRNTFRRVLINLDLF